MILSEKAYNILKYIALIVIPALATLVVSIGTAIGKPAQAQVISVIITAIGTFLGSIVVVSSNKYNKQQAEQQAEEQFTPKPEVTAPAGQPTEETTDGGLQ